MIDDRMGMDQFMRKFTSFFQLIYCLISRWIWDSFLFVVTESVFTFCGHVMASLHAGDRFCRFEQCHLPLAVSFPAPKINRDRFCGAGFNGCRVTLGWYVWLLTLMNGYTRGYHNFLMVYIPFDISGLWKAILMFNGFLVAIWGVHGNLDWINVCFFGTCSFSFRPDLKVMLSVQPCLLLCTWPISKRTSWRSLFGDISPFECTF